MFEELKASCEPLPVKERPRKKCISATTWALMDHRARLASGGRLTKRGSRGLKHQINASLKKDRQERTRSVGASVEANLDSGELASAWRDIKGWYRTVEDRAPNPCCETLETQTREREELYAKRTPPGEPIPINVDPFEIRDETPEDDEIRAVVKALKPGRAGGASKIRAEHMKTWLRGMTDEEECGTVDAGDKWRLFVWLIQSIWEQGCLPRQMQWVIVVLLPKGGGDFRGIGLIEPC